MQLYTQQENFENLMYTCSAQNKDMPCAFLVNMICNYTYDLYNDWIKLNQSWYSFLSKHCSPSQKISHVLHNIIKYNHSPVHSHSKIHPLFVIETLFYLTSISLLNPVSSPSGIHVTFCFPGSKCLDIHIPAITHHLVSWASLISHCRMPLRFSHVFKIKDFPLLLK